MLTHFNDLIKVGLQGSWNSSQVSWFSFKYTSGIQRSFFDQPWWLYYTIFKNTHFTFCMYLYVISACFFETCGYNRNVLYKFCGKMLA